MVALALVVAMQRKALEVLVAGLQAQELMVLLEAVLLAVAHHLQYIGVVQLLTIILVLVEERA